MPVLVIVLLVAACGLLGAYAWQLKRRLDAICSIAEIAMEDLEDQCHARS